MLVAVINSEDIVLYIICRTFSLKHLYLGVSMKMEKINRFIFSHVIKLTERQISAKQLVITAIV